MGGTSVERGTHRSTWDGLEELRPVLEGYLTRRCRDAAEVEDVVQETCLRAARYRGGLQDETKLRPWALRIARNVLADRLARRRDDRGGTGAEDLLENLPAEDPGEAEPEALRVGGWVVDRELCLGILRRALGSLREEDRVMLHTHYGGAGSCRETAAECGVPEELVKVRLYRARRRLLRAMRRRIALETGEYSGGER